MMPSSVCASVSGKCCAAGTGEVPPGCVVWTRIRDHTFPGWFLLKWAVHWIPEQEWRRVADQPLPAFVPGYGYVARRAAVRCRVDQPMKENAVAFYASVLT